MGPAGGTRGPHGPHAALEKTKAHAALSDTYEKKTEKTTMSKRPIGTVESNCIRFCVENFANIPEDILAIPVYVNTRLRTTLGMACSNRNTGERWIEVHKCVFADPDQMRDTLAHEIAHHWAGIPSGHNWVWKAHARALGHSGNRCATAQAAQSIGITRPPKRPLKIVAECERCDYVIERRRRLPNSKQYTHRGCGGRIKTV